MGPHDENMKFRSAANAQPVTEQQPPPSQVAHPQQAGMTAVPVNTMHTWNFHHKSSLDGCVYEGQFTCKKLSIMELSRLGVRKVQLNGGYHFDESKPGFGVEEHIDNMNSMLAHLEMAIVQAPIWFNPEEIYDPEILPMIYAEVAKFENSFFRRNRAPSEVAPSGQNDSSGADQESGTGGRATPVGGNQVQPSLDP